MTRTCENWKDFWDSWEISLIVFPFRWRLQHGFMWYGGMNWFFRLGPIHFEIEFFWPWAGEFKQKDKEE